MVHLRQSSRPRKALIASAVVTTFAIIGGIAFAAWTSTGAGSGRAASGTAVQLTVNASTGTADLFPGTTVGDVYFTITNTNPYPVTFTTMTLGSAITNTVAGDATACPPTNVTATGATGLSLVAPASSTSAMLSIPNVVSMASTAPDGCQTKTFEIPLTLSGASS
ncbi:MAG: hypothetical protein QOE93_1096 [Actinomycetota bacterium]|jgi:hypothetical protein|nr:hypothetical protein [Actinomycetota bacterium]